MDALVPVGNDADRIFYRNHLLCIAVVNEEPFGFLISALIEITTLPLWLVIWKHAHLERFSFCLSHKLPPHLVFATSNDFTLMMQSWIINPLISVPSVISSRVCNLKLLEMTVADLFGNKTGVELLSKYLLVPGGFRRNHRPWTYYIRKYIMKKG